MYPNFKAETARKGLTLNDIVSEMRNRGFKMTVPTLSLKLNKKYELTMKEGKALRDIVAPELSLDELFEEAS